MELVLWKTYSILNSFKTMEVNTEEMLHLHQQHISADPETIMILITKI